MPRPRGRHGFDGAAELKARASGSLALLPPARSWWSGPGSVPKLIAVNFTGNNGRKELSAAIWRPSLGLAEVVLQRGKAVAHLGVQQRSRLYLHPEEATCVVWGWVGMPSRPSLRYSSRPKRRLRS